MFVALLFPIVIFFAGSAYATFLEVDYILVEKKQRALSVYHNGKKIKQYKVALGFSPVGHKEQEGDGKTPEGKYFISHKNSKSTYHLSLAISYPSKQDRVAAAKKGVSPGGNIMIHGIKKKYSNIGTAHCLWDWTLGCIAVTNEEIEELFKATKVGTPVIIKP